MQCAPYAYVGLALGHNLDYGIHLEQGCGEKMKHHKAGGTGKSHVNSLPRWKAVMKRVHTWTQMAQLTFLKWNSSILHIQWDQKWWHVPTLWHPQCLKWSSDGSLLLCKVLCEELPKEQSYVKYHFIIPTVEAITEMAGEECSWSSFLWLAARHQESSSASLENCRDLCSTVISCRYLQTVLHDICRAALIEIL